MPDDVPGVSVPTKLPWQVFVERALADAEARLGPLRDVRFRCLHTHEGELRVILSLVAPDQPAAPQRPVPSVQPARASPDFRSFRDGSGALHALTIDQAAVVRVLWEAYQAGTPDVGHAYLLAACPTATTSRISDVFRGSSAWGTIVVLGGTKASLRLDPAGTPVP